MSLFSKCPDAQARIELLFDRNLISKTTKDYLQQNPKLSPELAENFIENAIGYFGVPIGIADHFVINGKAYTIPMAVEETSVIAACSKTAKWIKQHGTLTTKTIGNTIIGQIQIPIIENAQQLQKLIDSERETLITHLNRSVAKNMHQRGGGVKDISLRCIDHAAYPKKQMGVIHIYVDVQDAMGANIVNQIVEAGKKYLKKLSEEEFNICILSNLNPQTLVQAEIRLKNIPLKIMQAIESCSHFAESDPYRAATHNKGIMNGIDATLIATGNDWRAVEAGLHAYAGRDIGYKPLSIWCIEDSELVGRFEGPINVGIVGGVTNLHPMAKIALEILNPSSAKELSEIIAAVGLVQNLGAMRALSSTGITQGHMRLHIDNILLQFDISTPQKIKVRKHLEAILKEKNVISVQDAVEYLKANC